MSPLFARRSRNAAEATGSPAAEPAEPAEPAVGPFDAEHPEAPTAELVDLGALRIPARKDLKVRLDVDKTTGAVAAVTVGAGASTVQLTVFAAPRTAGVWDEVRQEIAAAVTGQGGTSDEVDGGFGTELLAKVPGTTKDGKKVLQVQRFCGVDGPRWFLRAVFSGPEVLALAGATVPEEVLVQSRGDLLEDLVRHTVVVRGPSPLAPREPLPLAIPEQARRAAAAAAARAAERAVAAPVPAQPTAAPPEQS